MFYLEPKFCLLFGDKADWHEVVDSAENEQFGNSEQLPSNPRKLPDWVKVGELGYEPMIGYYKIVNFFNKGKIVQILRFENNTTYALGIKDFNPYHCEARKRPFNADEMRVLVGKVLTDKGNGNVTMVTDFINEYDKYEDYNYCMIYAYGEHYVAEDLINEYTIDDKPCYKLEHLNEKGEWVE